MIHAFISRRLSGSDKETAAPWWTAWLPPAKRQDLSPASTEAGGNGRLGADLKAITGQQSPQTLYGEEAAWFPHDTGEHMAWTRGRRARPRRRHSLRTTGGLPSWAYEEDGVAASSALAAAAAVRSPRLRRASDPAAFLQGTHPCEQLSCLRYPRVLRGGGRDALAGTDLEPVLPADKANAWQLFTPLERLLVLAVSAGAAKVAQAADASERTQLKEAIAQKDRALDLIRREVAAFWRQNEKRHCSPRSQTGHPRPQPGHPATEDGKSSTDGPPSTEPFSSGEERRGGASLPGRGGGGEPFPPGGGLPLQQPNKGGFPGGVLGDTPVAGLGVTPQVGVCRGLGAWLPLPSNPTALVHSSLFPPASESVVRADGLLLRSHSNWQAAVSTPLVGPQLPPGSDPTAQAGGGQSPPASDPTTPRTGPGLLAWQQASFPGEQDQLPLQQPGPPSTAPLPSPLAPPPSSSPPPSSPLPGPTPSPPATFPMQATLAKLSGSMTSEAVATRTTDTVASHSPTTEPTVAWPSIDVASQSTPPPASPTVGLPASPAASQVTTPASPTVNQPAIPASPTISEPATPASPSVTRPAHPASPTFDRSITKASLSGSLSATPGSPTVNQPITLGSPTVGAQSATSGGPSGGRADAADLVALPLHPLAALTPSRAFITPGSDLTSPFRAGQVSDEGWSSGPRKGSRYSPAEEGSLGRARDLAGVMEAAGGGIGVASPGRVDPKDAILQLNKALEQEVVGPQHSDVTCDATPTSAHQASTRCGLALEDLEAGAVVMRARCSEVVAKAKEEAISLLDHHAEAALAALVDVATKAGEMGRLDPSSEAGRCLPRLRASIRQASEVILRLQEEAANSWELLRPAVLSALEVSPTDLQDFLDASSPSVPLGPSPAMPLVSSPATPNDYPEGKLSAVHASTLADSLPAVDKDSSTVTTLRMSLASNWSVIESMRASTDSTIQQAAAPPPEHDPTFSTPPRTLQAPGGGGDRTGGAGDRTVNDRVRGSGFARQAVERTVDRAMRRMMQHMQGSGAGGEEAGGGGSSGAEGEESGGAEGIQCLVEQLMTELETAATKIAGLEAHVVVVNEQMAAAERQRKEAAMVRDSAIQQEHASKMRASAEIHSLVDDVALRDRVLSEVRRSHHVVVTAKDNEIVAVREQLRQKDEQMKQLSEALASARMEVQQLAETKETKIKELHGAVDHLQTQIRDQDDLLVQLHRAARPAFPRVADHRRSWPEGAPAATELGGPLKTRSTRHHPLPLRLGRGRLGQAGPEQHQPALDPQREQDEEETVRRFPFLERSINHDDCFADVVIGDVSSEFGCGGEYSLAEMIALGRPSAEKKAMSLDHALTPLRPRGKGVRAMGLSIGGPQEKGRVGQKENIEKSKHRRQGSGSGPLSPWK